MTTTELARYQNGNCEVTVYSDGTKVREWPDGEEPRPEMPESVDLKITNWCDGQCPWCAEGSSRDGQDASRQTIREMLAGAQKGMEVAIGGGNPVRSSSLDAVVDAVQEQGLIANITVNAKHAAQDVGWVKFLRDMGIIHGIGLSYHPGLIKDMALLKTPDTVVHLIAGVDEPATIEECVAFGFEKFLVLGFKDMGRAKGRKIQWKPWGKALPGLLSRGILVSFDNLALKQLDVRGVVGEAAWRECFMGHDGQFTLFLDAVEDTFAVSSRHPRTPRNGKTLLEMFAEVRRSLYERP